jgi:hypothetical protein
MDAFFRIYLTTTVSPTMMNKQAGQMNIREITEDAFAAILKSGEDINYAVGHENTAKLLERRYGLQGVFNRVNLNLRLGDYVLAAVPLMRVDATRELTNEEIEKAEFRFFEAMVGTDYLLHNFKFRHKTQKYVQNRGE